APEHTLPAYKLGEQMHGDYIEIDLQMTKDGVLIAMHDETVDRTTNGTGYVKDMTLNEIKQLDAGSWFNEQFPDKAKDEYVGLKVPTLEEIIEKFGRGSRYYIETKAPNVYPGMEEELLRILEKHKLLGPNGPSSKVLLQSFSSESLKIINSINQNITLVQLISYSAPPSLTHEEIEVLEKDARGIGTCHARIDEAYSQKGRKQYLLMHPYSGNSREDMERVLQWGATGFFTNYPDSLNELLRNNTYNQ